MLHGGSQVGPDLLAPVLGRRVLGIGLLEHSQSEAHHRPALDLTFHEQRVDGPSDVVDLDQPGDRHLARLVVDLNVGHAGCVGHCRVRLLGHRSVVVVDFGERLERRALA